MLTISRTTGAVTGSITPEEREAMWRAIVKNMASKILAEQMAPRETEKTE